MDFEQEMEESLKAAEASLQAEAKRSISALGAKDRQSVGNDM